MEKKISCEISKSILLVSKAYKSEKENVIEIMSQIHYVEWKEDRSRVILSEMEGKGMMIEKTKMWNVSEYRCGSRSVL